MPLFLIIDLLMPPFHRKPYAICLVCPLTWVNVISVSIIEPFFGFYYIATFETIKLKVVIHYYWYLKNFLTRLCLLQGEVPAEDVVMDGRDEAGRRLGNGGGHATSDNRGSGIGRLDSIKCIWKYFTIWFSTLIWRNDFQTIIVKHKLILLNLFLPDLRNRFLSRY